MRKSCNVGQDGEGGVGEGQGEEHVGGAERHGANLRQAPAPGRLHGLNFAELLPVRFTMV